MEAAGFKAPRSLLLVLVGRLVLGRETLPPLVLLEDRVQMMELRLVLRNTEGELAVEMIQPTTPTAVRPEDVQFLVAPAAGVAALAVLIILDTRLVTVGIRHLILLEVAQPKPEVVAQAQAEMETLVPRQAAPCAARVVLAVEEVELQVELEARVVVLRVVAVVVRLPTATHPAQAVQAARALFTSLLTSKNDLLPC